MTADDIRHQAQVALDRIRRQPKGSVYASRKGIVAGVNFYKAGYVLVFHRKVGRVQLERWPQYLRNSASISVHRLPDDLEAEAAAMLDAL